MRIEQLKMVVAVAEQKHIGPAADQLYVTPQNISKGIHQLEEELQTELFKRTKRGMILTKDGQMVYDVACDILQRVDYLANAFFSVGEENAYTNISGTLSLLYGVSLNAAVYRLERVLRRRYPQVHLHCSEYDSRYVWKMILKTENVPEKMFDMAFFTLLGEADFPEWMREKYDVYYLKSERTGVLMRADDRRANRSTISAEELKQLPIVAYSSTEGELSTALQSLKVHGITIDPAIVTNSFFTWETYIKDGIGYGIVGSDYKVLRTPEHNEKISFIPIKEQIVANHYLVTNKKENMLPAEKAMLEIIKDLYFDTLKEI